MKVSNIQPAIDVLTVLAEGTTEEIDNLPEVRGLEGDSTLGICHFVNYYIPGAFTRLCFKTWEHYSGHMFYPVPLGKCDPVDAYMMTNNMYEGEYGELRRDLARHLIECLEAELEAINKEELKRKASNDIT